MNWELAPGLRGLADATHPKWLLQWLFRGTGKLSSNFMEAVAHVRTQSDLVDPDFQFINGPAYVWDFGRATHPQPAAAILQSFWTPRSRGTVMARSADPRDAPGDSVEHAHRRGRRRGIRPCRPHDAPDRSHRTPGLYAETRNPPGPHVTGDAGIAEWVRETCGTTGHPACSAAMGTSADSVLDERLRVRGVAGLRVADTSALPLIPRANTNAPAILVAERCADFIRRACG